MNAGLTLSLGRAADSWLKHVFASLCRRLAYSDRLVVGLHLVRGITDQRIIDYYPDLVRCMDEQTQQRDLQNGLSDYWQAKYISMLSRDGLRVVQLDPRLNPWHQINNRHWYAQTFDFVMVNHSQVPDFRLDRALIIARFGQPDDSFWCGKSEVLVYRSMEFREQFLTRFP